MFYCRWCKIFTTCWSIRGTRCDNFTVPHQIAVIRELVYEHSQSVIKSCAALYYCVAVMLFEPLFIYYVYIYICGVFVFLFSFGSLFANFKLLITDLDFKITLIYGSSKDNSRKIYKRPLLILSQRKKISVANTQRNFSVINIQGYFNSTITENCESIWTFLVTTGL